MTVTHRLAAAAAAAFATGCALFGAGPAAADPGGWVGPFPTRGACVQKASGMVGPGTACKYRSGDSRGRGYYFFYQP